MLSRKHLAGNDIVGSVEMIGSAKRGSKARRVDLHEAQTI